MRCKICEYPFVQWRNVAMAALVDGRRKHVNPHWYCSCCRNILRPEDVDGLYNLSPEYKLGPAYKSEVEDD